MQTFEQRNIWRHSTIIFFFLLKRHWSKRETVKGGKGKSIKKKKGGRLFVRQDSIVTTNTSFISADTF